MNPSLVHLNRKLIRFDYIEQLIYPSLEEGILKDGIIKKEIIVREDGNIVDGVARWAIATKHGLDLPIRFI